MLAAVISDYGVAAGATVAVEPVSPDMITESSNMTRSLCVQLTDVGDGLDRAVFIGISFLPQGYSQPSKLLSNLKETNYSLG